MEQAGNPYAAPRVVVDGAPGDGQFQEARLFAVAGRIGRIRYLSHLTGVYLLATLLTGLVAASLAGLGIRGNGVTYTVMGVCYSGMFVLWFMLAIQRCHDLDSSGWLSLLYLIPLINFMFFLYLLFMPGDKEPNRFGAPTSPNGVLSVLIACLFPALLLIVFLVVLGALPSYRYYI